ncbi:Calcium/calmodulin-dependent 3',5'-cyclic nucleotide phosphodiesterase 1C [Collichthys lucidus]|uniref:Calcium/calmodulin-dependent 3',5'-cyclic nucleotide phosphodiesterase 1C n=1 Tax=Collichthys lucidus TaxID=240159 RepID=A0A4U5VST7_COLLU|nr:Calcium/calmodulin-dependent 3',5'-cyclic nucleotide phosphodiesterase 1C [Collichthys lucidus]
MALVQKLHGDGETFADADYALSTVLAEASHSTRVDIVFDVYNKASIKHMERVTRGAAYVICDNLKQLLLSDGHHTSLKKAKIPAFQKRMGSLGSVLDRKIAVVTVTPREESLVQSVTGQTVNFYRTIRCCNKNFGLAKLSGDITGSWMLEVPSNPNALGCNECQCFHDSAEMNEEVEVSQLSVEVLEAEEQEQQKQWEQKVVQQQEKAVGQEEVEFEEGQQEEVVLHQKEEQELQQKKEEHQGGQMLLEEQEEVQQLKELQQTEEEELQKEEVQTEKMSWTKEQQIEVQQQTEQELWIEKEQHQTEKGQIEELQDFDDPLERTQNNQVLIRLRGMLKEVLEQMDRGVVDLQELRRNLELAAAMLDAIYTDETRRLLDTEDELSEFQAESVPREVRDWLACTFSRKMGVTKRRPEEKPRFRSIVHAVQAGIFVERRTSNMAGLTYPPTALTALKKVDQWAFDVFSFHEATGDHALKFLVYDLLTRYDLINRFRVHAASYH